VVTGMVAGRGGAVGATIARRAGGARARPCTQKAIDLPNWLPRCPAGSVAAMGGRRVGRWDAAAATLLLGYRVASW
jgi:hypothetical protein